MFTGDQIRLTRKKRGLSAEKLAEVLGTSKDNIYKWEKGHRPQSGEAYQKVENWLGGKLENVPRETESTDRGIDTLMQAVLNLTESNKILAESNRVLAYKINSDGTGVISPPLQEKNVVQLDPVEQKDASGGKKVVHYEKKKRKQQKDIAS